MYGQALNINSMVVLISIWPIPVSSTLTTIIIRIPTGTSQPQTIGQKKEAQMHNLALDYLSGFGMKAGINYTSYHSESHQQFTKQRQQKKQTSEISYD